MIHHICQFQLPMIRGMAPLKPSIWLIVEVVGITILDSHGYFITRC